MKLRVPHVTSYTRAPSSLLFINSAECALPTNASLFVFLREFWRMPLPLMNDSALVLFAQRTRIPTSARSIGFCVIWVFSISASSSSAHLVLFYRYRGIQYSKYPLQPIPSILPIRILTRYALLPSASFPDYGDPSSARSHDATALEGTLRTATLATGDELFSGALQRSPGATILTNARVLATPANNDELRYGTLQRSF